MARQEEATSAAASAEKVATMMGSPRESIFLIPPCPSEHQKSKRVPKPNEFVSPRLHSIKRPPQAGVSPVGRQSQKSHEDINNGEGDNEIST